MVVAVVAVVAVMVEAVKEEAEAAGKAKYACRLLSSPPPRTSDARVHRVYVHRE